VHEDVPHAGYGFPIDFCVAPLYRLVDTPGRFAKNLPKGCGESRPGAYGMPEQACGPGRSLP
jgi:hypothetical protein